MFAPGRIACALTVAVAVLPICAETNPARPVPLPSEPARQLVRDVIYNELHDREHDSHWEYLSECVSSSQNIVREQVETSQGPVFRILEENGEPLDAAQRAHENQRIDRYIQDPTAVARVLHAHQEDEARLASIMQLLPRAFLFSYDGPPSGDVVRLAFRPDPAFVPSGYEARIVHALAGTLTVNLRFRRMIDMRGTVSQRVDFGYGLLGHVDRGGTFEIHRTQVSNAHWKTDLVDVHVGGKILMLKTVSKDQREVRSGFRPVPADTTLAGAKQMLNATPDEPVEAHLEPAAATR